MPAKTEAPTRRALVTAAGTLALLGSTASVQAASSGDVELLRLGAMLEAAWAEEKTATAMKTLSDEQFGPFVDRSADIVHEIEKHPATTLQGLAVKARACSWCRSGDPFEDDSFADNPTTDARLAAALIRDLLSIAVSSTWSN